MVTAKLPPGPMGVCTGSHSVLGQELPSFVWEVAGDSRARRTRCRDRSQRPWESGKNRVRQVRWVS